LFESKVVRKKMWAYGEKVIEAPKNWRNCCVLNSVLLTTHYEDYTNFCVENVKGRYHLKGFVG
jgi:hypothetical protein